MESELCRPEQLAADDRWLMNEREQMAVTMTGFDSPSDLIATSTSIPFLAIACLFDLILAPILPAILAVFINPSRADFDLVSPDCEPLNQFCLASPDSDFAVDSE